MAEACAALDMPIVSGNVSLYNETKNDDGTGSAILPTPAIGGIGLLQDWTNSATIAFKAESEAIFVIGDSRGHLGQNTEERRGGREWVSTGRSRWWPDQSQTKQNTEK